MLGSCVVVAEGFVVVSGQVDDEEGANVLNVTIWVEGSVLEYEPRCVAKTPGNFSIMYQHAGGGPDTGTKENPVLETV